MRRLRVLLPLAVVLGVPSVALAFINLMTAGGFLFDIDDTYAGELSNGSIDAYDGAYYLEVNGTTYTSSGAAATTTMSGRNVVMPEVTIAGLAVHREIYVPMTGGDYGRYLDVLRNTGTTSVTATVTIRGNLGSDSSTILYATSSGDTILTTADQWFGTDDTDGTSDPSLAHVFQGDSPTVSATSATLSSDNFDWSFPVTVAPGERVAVLTFAVQTMNRAGAQTEARRLAGAPDDALVGLDDYLDEIVNFGLATPGAPRITFEAPYEMNEGDELEVMVMVDDLEGDPTTWSWDTDGDGTFGDLAGMASYTIPAGSTDGPGSVRIGVQASDGTNTAERYRTISVNNVEPMVTSSPPSLVASVGAPWVYQVEVLDPGGDADPLLYALTRAPERMVIGTDGRITWTPNERDVTLGGDTVSVEVTVDDGDMGTTTQAWEMTVSPNRAPSEPVPLYPAGDETIAERSPRLIAANAVDPDVEDTLTYYFELDTVDTFDSPNLLESGAVEETPGFTYYYVPEPLAPGHYFWRVWVTDSVVTTEPRVESFWVYGTIAPTGDGGVGSDGGVVVLPDGGTGRESDGGCGCTVAQTRVPSPLAIGLGVFGAFVAFRRRRFRPMKDR